MHADPKFYKNASSFIHRASVDHIVPINQGGGETDENLRLTHQSCNGYINGDNCAPFQPFDRTPYLKNKDDSALGRVLVA